MGLLLLLAIPLFFSVAIMVKQKVLQFQRNERFETETLQTIKVAPEKIFWLDDENEVIVNGRLFDVASVQKAGDKMILTGFFDGNEERLVSQLKDNQDNNTQNPINQLAVKFLLVPLYYEPASFSLQNGWQFIALHFSTYSELICSRCATAVSPPPKC